MKFSTRKPYCRPKVQFQPRQHINRFFVYSLMSGLTLIHIACNSKSETGYVGSAVVEAEAWKVSPSTQGIILLTTLGEGDSVHVGEFLALVDTLPFALQREELLAGAAELRAQLEAKVQERTAIQVELGGAARDLKRMSTLVKEGSAPEQQADKLNTGYQSAQAKAAAAKSIKRS